MSSSRSSSSASSARRNSSARASAASSYSSHTASSTARSAKSSAAAASAVTDSDCSSRAAFRSSLSRVEKLFGAARAAMPTGPQYSSSRLAYMPLELLRVTAEDKPAANLLQPGKKSYWSTASGQNHELVFKISSSCLLGFVKILNRSVSHMEISIAMHDVASQYVTVQTDLHAPHNKTVMYPIGFLPARYIKVKCARGAPCAIYNVSVVGVLERIVWREMGPQLGSLIVEHPESLLLPAKPHADADAALTFPAFQTVKEDPQEPKPRIRQCVRQ